MSRFQQYRHSGKLGIGVPLGLVAGAATAIAGAWLYQRFVIWVPFIYVTFLGTLAFGAGIGVAVGYAMRAGKTRSLLVPAIIAGLCGVLGEAASFKFDYSYRMAEAAEELSASGETEEAITGEDLEQAISFSDYIGLRAEQGFSIGRGGSGGLPLQGALVYLIWLIELGAMAGAAVVLARGRFTDTFCEHCEQWMKERTLGMRMGVDSGHLRMAATDGDLAALFAPPPDPESPINVAYSVHECARCRANPYLTVSLAWIEQNKKGEDQEKKEAIAYQVRTTPADIATLEQDLGSPAPADA